MVRRPMSEFVEGSFAAGSDEMHDRVPRESFVAGMRNAACGVTVITTNGLGGRYGATVSAMTSVCAEPPALLVCVNHENLVAQAVARNGAFCVNVLNEDQVHISDIFAGRALPPRADRFAHGIWNTLTTGAPVLQDALTAFDCRLAKQSDFGSHAVFIGVVVGVQAGKGSPLLYYDRAYRKIGTPRDASLQKYFSTEPNSHTSRTS